jgi:hypothetical protein
MRLAVSVVLCLQSSQSSPVQSVQYPLIYELMAGLVKNANSYYDEH